LVNNPFLQATAKPIHATVPVAEKSDGSYKQMKTSQTGLIRLIAVFKLLKAASLLIVGFGILKLMHTDVATQLEHWIAMLGFDPGSRIMSRVLQKATNVSPDKIREFGVVSFIYAGLFLTEGIGLWLMKRWAEWFTVAITSSLLPLEIYEIFHRPTLIKILVLIINVAVVAYLLYRITSESRNSAKQVMGRMTYPPHGS
jgi:uncharacterized membrane protein (DUF2068 family)